MSYLELAEIRALRRLGKDIWPRKDVLRRHALSLDLPLKDRRRAARTFVVAAEESFAGAEAVAHLPSLSSLWADSADIDAVELGMLVNLALGDVHAAVPLAKTLIQRIDEYPALTQSVTMSAVARCLFAAGLTEESLAISREELESARRVGMSGEIAMATARLADSYLTLADVANGRRWVEATREHATTTPYAHVYHLYNCVMLATVEGNFRLARAELESLRNQDEATKKHAQRGIIGMALLLENAMGVVVNADFDEDALRRLDDSAWRHSEHLFFAVGLFLLLSARGRRDEARERLRDYFTNRRREYYDPRPILSILHLERSQLEEVFTLLPPTARGA